MVADERVVDSGRASSDGHSSAKRRYDDRIASPSAGLFDEFVIHGDACYDGGRPGDDERHDVTDHGNRCEDD